MTKQYIDVPLYTTFNDIRAKDFSLSATQYKSLCIKNKNVVSVRELLSRDLKRSDLGSEVGSDAYVESSNYFFIKTKALQSETYLLDINKESVQNITPLSFKNSNLKKGDLLISKDSNVGEIVILDKDYPNTMLCSGIYKLPIIDKKYYLLAFIKSNIFRQQIDFLVPRGSTIRHGKTKFLECLIPLPNENSTDTINYVETLMKAILNKEIEIKKKYKQCAQKIKEELEENQKEKSFEFSMPTYKEILLTDRMDSNRYCEEYKKFRFLLTNYKYGFSSLLDYGYKIRRGQNLQISAIGKSIYTDIAYPNFYKLILSQDISYAGTITGLKFLGNKNKLSLLKKGDMVFSSRGHLGRSVVILDDDEQITNIDSMVFYGNKNIQKSVFVHAMLDFYRSHNFLKKIGINGSAAESLTKYQIPDIPFPDFPNDKEKEITEFYFKPFLNYEPNTKSIADFEAYDQNFNMNAGIYNLDSSMKYLTKKLEHALNSIAQDKLVEIRF